MVSDLLFHILILIDGNCFIILKVLLYLIYLHKKNPFGFFFFVFFVFFVFSPPLTIQLIASIIIVVWRFPRVLSWQHIAYTITGRIVLLEDAV